jgi:hypothetical protein
MRRIGVTLLCLVSFLVAGYIGSAAAETFVGIVKSVEGGAVIKRDSQTIKAAKGMHVVKGDTVATDAQGAIGLVFSDDTLISMGPNTELVIDDYLFEPLEKELSFVARIIRGTVSFLSGQIARLSPETVQLVMPAATIGVRGTHVLIKVDE